MIYLAQAAALCNRKRALNPAEVRLVAALSQEWIHLSSFGATDPDISAALERVSLEAEANDVRRAMFAKILENCDYTPVHTYVRKKRGK